MTQDTCSRGTAPRTLPAANPGEGPAALLELRELRLGAGGEHCR
jgi:hypothetical protein